MPDRGDVTGSVTSFVTEYFNDELHNRDRVRVPIRSCRRLVVMKIAIIGSGAAALGVLDRLSMLIPTPEVILIDRAERVPSKPQFDHWTSERLRLLYQQMWAEHGNVFPPPKTNFGLMPNMRTVENWGRVWDSNAYGGLPASGACARSPLALMN